MTWTRQILTGPDNSTVSIGRMLGAVLFVLLLVVFPVVELVTVLRGTVPPDIWGGIYAGLATYVPAIILAIGGLIAGTHFTEPRAPGHTQNSAEESGND